MIGTIKQKLSFEENVYEDNHFMFDIDEFEFLDKAHKKGMPIRFYNSKDYLVMNPCDDIYMKEQLHMPEKLWTMACDMAESDVPVFSFAYYPWELHFPMLCGYMTNEPQIKQFADVGLEDMGGFIKQQFADCLDYVDKQFSYYKSFFAGDMTTVIMADHSQPVYDETRNDPYFMFCNDKDRVCHVAFIIATAGCRQACITGWSVCWILTGLWKKRCFNMRFMCRNGRLYSTSSIMCRTGGSGKWQLRGG